MDGLQKLAQFASRNLVALGPDGAGAVDFEQIIEMRLKLEEMDERLMEMTKELTGNFKADVSTYKKELDKMVGEIREFHDEFSKLVKKDVFYNSLLVETSGLFDRCLDKLEIVKGIIDSKVQSGPMGDFFVDSVFILDHYDLFDVGFGPNFDVGKNFSVGGGVSGLFTTHKVIPSAPLTYIDPKTGDSKTDERMLYAIGVDFYIKAGYTFYRSPLMETSAVLSASYGVINPNPEFVVKINDTELYANATDDKNPFSRFEALLKLQSGNLFLSGGAGAFCDYDNAKCFFMMTVGGGISAPQP